VSAVSESATETGRLPVLTLTALGIVYGDIGTSPLYALRECFSNPELLSVTPANVLGVLSLMFWSLILVVTLKYITFILRADNQGEGGILALMTLVIDRYKGGAQNPRARAALLVTGIAGTAFIYSDAMITPAISVLSAVEGLHVLTPAFEPYVIPVTLGILVGLYVFQYHGTEDIGKVFGPIVLLWFATLAVLGLISIAHTPWVLIALNPLHALTFFTHNGWIAFVILGIVFLVVTGAEALYADMGHFGKEPIRLAWFAVVLPGLTLNYFGQGALLLREPGAHPSLFFEMAPGWAQVPLVALATAATVIASQAVISGAFSLTAQGIQLGLLPRLQVVQTSARMVGQIYVPAVNWVFLAATVSLVLAFGTSSRLADAYGLAVAAAMLLTTFFLYVVARRVWHWRPVTAASLAIPFIVIHLVFFLATLIKIPTGGWFPLLGGFLIYGGIRTWARGRKYVQDMLRAESFPLKDFLQSLGEHKDIQRVRGTAVFLTRDEMGVPRTLLHNLKHNKVLHDINILVTVRTERIPRVPRTERAEVEDLGSGFYRVVLRYGFYERPNLPFGLEDALAPHFELDLMTTTFFLGRETLLVARRSDLDMSAWRRRLFAYMQHNTADAAKFFSIPPNRVIELGVQLEI
jgi:KUP system potassium uptake protein